MAREEISKFTKEFRRTLGTAVVAAFGFIVALAWNDVVQELVGKITSLSPIQGKLISAIVITIVAVLVIIFVTHFIKGK